MAKRLRRKNPVTGERRSLREIAQLLADAGHLAASGKPYAPGVINAMVKGGGGRSSAAKD